MWRRSRLGNCAIVDIIILTIEGNLMLLIATALSLQLAVTAPHAGIQFPPAPRRIDQNIGGPIFPTLYGLNLQSTGPLQATVVVSASTGTEVHHTPNAGTTLMSLLEGRTWGSSTLIAQGDEFAVSVVYSNPPLPGMVARFARISPDGQVIRTFNYLVDNGPFASTSAGEFQILGRTLRPMPENAPTIDLAWCGVDCGFAGNGTLEAKAGGAWFVRRADCALIRVGRDGSLLEALSLPIPSEECTSLQFSRDPNQGLRIASRAGAFTVYALNINDDGPANIVAGLTFDGRSLKSQPLAGGDWLFATTGANGSDHRLTRWRPQPLKGGTLATGSLQWETTKNFGGSGYQFYVASSLDGAIAICSSVQGFRLNALGQEVQALPSASGVAFDAENNLALLRYLGLPKLLDWYSPSGNLLRSDALGPVQTLAYSARGRYYGAGKLSVQYGYVMGQVDFDDVRQYGADGALISSYRAMGTPQSKGSINSDYWYNLRTDAQGVNSMLVRHLPSQTSTLVPIPCEGCNSFSAFQSTDIENGLLFYGPANGVRQKFWIFQGTQLQTLDVFEFGGVTATPLHPAGDIVRFIGATATGQPRMVFGIDESGTVSSRFPAPESTYLEPSGGLYGRPSFNTVIKIDANGVVDPSWRPCGFDPLVFTAYGHWGRPQNSGNSRVICFAGQSETISALIDPSVPYANMEHAFGPGRNEMLAGNQLYAVANGQIVVRSLISYPVALTDNNYAYFTRNSNSNELSSLPLPSAQALQTLDPFIFANGFE